MKLLNIFLRIIAKYYTDIFSARKNFMKAEQYGIHVTPNHFYYPIPDLAKLPDKLWVMESTMPGVDLREKEQVSLLTQVFTKYISEYRSIPVERTLNDTEFYINNKQFTGADPFLLYALIKYLSPSKIIEVGSGYSTLISIKALRENEKGNISCIEPYPPLFLKKALIDIGDLKTKQLQEIPPAYFQQLKKNDILFIDSSHVVKIGGDVSYLFLEILPILNPGVWIHIHDIFFPHNYPEKWVKEMNFFWSEQYMLQAFLIGNNKFRTRFSVSYMGKKYTKEMKNIFPGYQIGLGGGSFWMEKIS